ncbi:MAG TPA: DUF488 domain-containing protein [Stellaceae bacterium]|nr:DUF488 domain-containing protein [Stellaceae bacterium]
MSAAFRPRGAIRISAVRRLPRRSPRQAFSTVTCRNWAAVARRREGVSPHTLWRETAFRNYADYAESETFRQAFAALLDCARERRTAIMCAETVWWRCHRRIIADYLIAAGETVTHILDVGRTEPARLTEGAVKRADGTVLYAGPDRLLL